MKTTYLRWWLLCADIVPWRVKILEKKKKWLIKTLYTNKVGTQDLSWTRGNTTRSKESNIKSRNIKQSSDRWMTHISVPVRWTPGFDTIVWVTHAQQQQIGNKLPKEQTVQALDDGGTTTCSQPWGAFVLPVGVPIRPGSVAQLRRPYIPAWYWWGIPHVCQGMGHEAVRGVRGVEDGGVEG